MTRRAREIETLLLTMFAAVPLYLTYATGRIPLLVFHVVMGAICVRVATGRTPELIPAAVMRWLAVAYVPFYFLDWRFFAGTAISASTHLVLFIAVYQPIEAMQRNNQSQRMLTTALIFVASLATSTHITITLFVVAFAFLMFRQLMYVSHLETTRSIEVPYAEAPSGRAAAFYLFGAVLIGALLFPLLPRVRDPLVSGRLALPGSSTALSDSINFGEARTGSNDDRIVARVWMNEYARTILGPVRLRGMIYDRYVRGEWRQTQYGIRPLTPRGDAFILGRPSGAEAEVIVQSRAPRGKVYLPAGTYLLGGLDGRLYEGPARDTYYTYADGNMNLTARVSTNMEPLRLTRVRMPSYPITPEVRALALSIVGGEARPEQQARLIENYLLRNFRYRPNTDTTRQPMTIEQFLLRDRAGHCEHFAAGMVVLLTALEVPSRMAGGFYGGRRNPLAGYYSIRWSDAHAWTEVWNGTRWVTFDATPADLRPGSATSGALREYLAAIGDSLTFAWDRYVLTFGLGDQVALVQDAIDWGRQQAATMRQQLRSDARDVSSLPYLSLLGLVIVGGLALAIVARRRRPLFDQLAGHLKTLGIEVGPAMTMEEAVRQLRRDHPDAAVRFEPLIALYEEERFSSRPDRQRVAAIRRKLAELKA